MGDYATWTDVTGRYPKVSTVGDADAIADSYIDGAEAYINAALSKLFAVPVADKPSLLEDICIDLVYSKIMLHKDKAAKDVGKAARDSLRMIVDGELLLVDAAGDAIPTQGSAVWSTTQDYHHTHTMLGAEGDCVDPDWLEDLDDERS